MDEQKKESWLESPEFRRLISDAARSVLGEVISRSLSFSFLGEETGQVCSRKELVRNMESELLLFILENRPKILRMLRQAGRSRHCFLRRAFVNHWIEKTRSPFKDSQRYLYKHAADLMRTSEKFHLLMQNPSTLTFSMSQNSVPIPPLSSEDLEEIAFPNRIAERLEFSHISQKKVLLGLAEHFWHGLCEMWGNKPVRVAIGDFINWIGLHVPIREAAVKKLRLENHLSEMSPTYVSTADKIYFNPELVRTWAGNFANRLDDKEKSVFLLRHGLGLGLKEIAERLGYKGSSGPKYPLDRAEGKLRFFLCDLPWLSPDDFNEEAFSLFRETLLSLLKQNIETL